MTSKLLTIDEFNAVDKYCTNLKHTFIPVNKNGKTQFLDYETHRFYCLKTGLQWLSDSIVYEPEHDGINKTEYKIIIKLFNELGVK